LNITHVGVADIKDQSTLNVFPSPASDHVTLEINLAEASDVKITLLNVSGQIIYSEAVNQVKGNYKKQIDLKENAKGIYFLKVITNNQSITKKIIKE
jgi:hypothetical protein